MNLKELACRMGMHDWHINNYECHSSIERRVANELDPCVGGESRPNVHSMVVHEDKLCTNCGKEVDEISEYYKHYKDKMLKVQQLGGVVLPKKHQCPPTPPPPPKSK